ncbi:MAG TPA: hypothetical protein VH482_10560 [Thermomicrobiales bacterium]|jgi:hypothetical protein
MAIDDGAATNDPERAGSTRSRLFAVRLWTEEVAGGHEYRGSARDVLGGAFRGFREWSDLIAFMVARMEEDVRKEARKE